MKKLIGSVIFGLIIIFTTSCDRIPVSQIFGGNHILRKMGERVESNSHVSGSFFLFAGSLTQSTETVSSVKFAWLMNDGKTYAISSLPIEKIRVVFDDKAETPTIKFNYHPDQTCPLDWSDHTQEIMDYYVASATVTIKGSDWPVQIQMPLNEQ